MSSPAAVAGRLWETVHQLRRVERRLFGRGGQGGWPRILRNTLVSFIVQAGTRMAAALSYYALLAAGPLLVLTIGLGGMVLGEEGMRTLLAQSLPRLLPTSAGLPSQLAEQMVQGSPSATGLAIVTGVFSLIGFTRALAASLNVTLNEVGGEPIHRTALLVPLLYLVVVGLLCGSWLLEFILGVLRSNGIELMVPKSDLILGDITPLILAIFLVGVILAIVPRAPLTFVEIAVPAVVGGVLWEGARNLFGWLVGTDSFYIELFGPLGGMVALLGWIYLSSVILVITGEFAWAFAMERRGRGHLARQMPRQARLDGASEPFEVDNAVNEAQQV